MRRFNPGDGPRPPSPPDSGEEPDDVIQAGLKRRRLAPPPEPMPPGLRQASLSHWIRTPVAQAHNPQAPRPMARTAAPPGPGCPASNQCAVGRQTSPGPTSRGNPDSTGPGLDRGPPQYELSPSPTPSPPAGAMPAHPASSPQGLPKRRRLSGDIPCDPPAPPARTPEVQGHQLNTWGKAEWCSRCGRVSAAAAAGRAKQTLHAAPVFCL